MLSMEGGDILLYTTAPPTGLIQSASGDKEVKGQLVHINAKGQKLGRSYCYEKIKGLAEVAIGNQCFIAMATKDTIQVYHPSRLDDALSKCKPAHGVSRVASHSRDKVIYLDARHEALCSVQCEMETENLSKFQEFRSRGLDIIRNLPILRNFNGNYCGYVPPVNLTGSTLNSVDPHEALSVFTLQQGEQESVVTMGAETLTTYSGVLGDKIWEVNRFTGNEVETLETLMPPETHEELDDTLMPSGEQNVQTRPVLPPCGCTDDKGNIYISDGPNNNVLVLDSEGQYRKVLFDQSNHVFLPSHLCFLKATSQLCVVHKESADLKANDVISVFDVRYSL